MHSQRREDALLHELLVWHSADYFDNASCRIDSSVAVEKFCTRLILQDGLAKASHADCEGFFEMIQGYRARSCGLATH